MNNHVTTFSEFKPLEKVVDFSDSSVQLTIRKMISKELTEQEFFVFLQMCKNTGLNPISREIWAIVTGKGDYRQLQLMVGIEGYLRIANSHTMYDGYEMEIIRNAQGKLIEAICKVYRKDRARPSIGRAVWGEDNAKTDKAGSPWVKMPTYMLSKVAKSRALRDAFPNELNGTYTPDEFSDYSAPTPLKMIGEKRSEKETLKIEHEKFSKKISEAKSLDELKEIWDSIPYPEPKQSLSDEKNNKKSAIERIEEEDRISYEEAFNKESAQPDSNSL